MKWKAVTAALVFMLMVVLSCVLVDQSEPANALPEDYPIRLSGGFAEEVPGTTTYVDYLQPDDTENYLIHLDNDRQVEIRYRITISDIPQDWLVFLENGAMSMPVDMDPFQSKAVALYLKDLDVGTGELLINVSEEGTPNHWEMTLKIICQRGPLLVSIDSNSYILGRDSPAEVKISLKNIGDTVLNVSLEINGLIPVEEPDPSLWSVVYSDRRFLIPPGAEKLVTAKVSSPELEPIGSQKVTLVEAEVEGISRPYSSNSFTLRVSTIYDLRTTLVPLGYQLVSPGRSIQFTLSLENWATETDYVLVSEDSIPGGWSIMWNDTHDPTGFAVSVSPESKRDFHPVVYVPGTAIAGKHDVVLKAKGVANTTEVVLRIQVERKDNIEAVSAPPGGGDTYGMSLGINNIPVVIRNRGNFYDTVELDIENRPAWAPSSFMRIIITSDGANSTVSGSETVNASLYGSGILDLRESDLDSLSVTLAPSQSVTVVLRSTVPMDSVPSRGVMGIRYRYGVLGNQKLLQLPLKLVIVDLKIVENKLDIWPKPDYEVGETIHFTFSIRNDYPFATREGEVKWRIELAGVILLKGDIPSLQPGEVKTFNRSWKSDKSTNLQNPAYLYLYGNVYENEEQAPSARTDEEIFIEPSGSTHAWGLMVAFAVFMFLLIAVVLGGYIYSLQGVRERERQERERYESIYGRKGGRRLGEGRSRELRGRRAGRTPALDRKERPSLPSKEEGEKKPQAGKKRKDREGKIRSSRKAPSLKDSKVARNPAKPDGKKELEELEVLEEVEEAGPSETKT
ncbi:MAG: hypothetical protein ACMUIE_03305 [Thermoplasmatota archaeon]